MSKVESAFCVYDQNIECIEFREEPCEVHITADINSDTVSEFETNFRQAIASGQPEIPVVIHSPGGCVYSAMKIVDIILSSPVPVTTCVRGMAMSAAVLIFSCGSRRVMSPHAGLMIHTVRSEMGEMTVSEMEIDLKETNRLNSLTFQIMAKNCGLPLSYFKEIRDKNIDKHLSAAQALKDGICTDIGDVRLRTFIRSESILDVLPPAKKRKQTPTKTKKRKKRAKA